MKLAIIFIAAFSVGVPSVARPSGFEFCDFQGDVQHVVEQPRHTFELTVVITDASRAKEHGELSYTDCREYIDRQMQVSLFLRSDTPTAGDEILFSRSAVDGFTSDGSYVGTTVKAYMLELHKAHER
jgi:hypothetical protein